MIDPFTAGAVALVVGTVVMFWLRDRRDKKRLLAGQCAYCAETLLPDDCFRLEGRVICGRCACRARKRITRAVWGLITIGILFLAAMVLGAVLSIRRGDADWWEMSIFTLGSLAGLALLGWSAVNHMKGENEDSGRLDYWELYDALGAPSDNRSDDGDD